MVVAHHVKKEGDNNGNRTFHYFRNINIYFYFVNNHINFRKKITIKMANHENIHYRFHEFKDSLKKSNPSFTNIEIIELFKCEILNKRLLAIQEEITLLRKKNG